MLLLFPEGVVHARCYRKVHSDMLALARFESDLRTYVLGP